MQFLRNGRGVKEKKPKQPNNKKRNQKQTTGNSPIPQIICCAGKDASLALRTRILGKKQIKTVEKTEQLYLGMHKTPT